MEQKILSSTMGLLEFYNRYLGIENDDHFLSSLIIKLSDVFKNKISDSLTIQEVKQGALSFNTADLTNLSKFELGCLKFHQNPVIKVSSTRAIKINCYGMIHPNEDGLEAVNNPSITDYLDKIDAPKKARKDLKNVIAQNILVSKIYQVIYQVLNNKDYLTANLFYMTYKSLIDYEEVLNNVFDVNLVLRESFGRTRSQK